jgi:Holliday junction resolvasome RuvABC ATP-dependent DNA helicase subunit
VLEDFILPNGENRKLKPFLFIGATTEKATLLKKFSPLVDRCGAQINLCSYKKEDLIEILRQYNNNVYSVKIENEIYEIIAKNCRHTPRVAITYFDDYIITKDIKKVLRIHRIVKDSLTDIDFKILSYLNGVKSAGEEVLSIIAETTKQDYKQLLEPFLLTEGYITRDKTGRKILNKGIDLIKE